MYACQWSAFVLCYGNWQSKWIGKILQCKTLLLSTNLLCIFGLWKLAEDSSWEWGYKIISGLIIYESRN